MHNNTNAASIKDYGLGIVRIDRNNIKYEVMGYADVKNAAAITPQTLFQVGSISKSLTAWGVLRLVDMGLVKLDSSAFEYIHTWKLPDSKYDYMDITIRSLLNHTSGLSVHGYMGRKQKIPEYSLVESLDGYKGYSRPLRIVDKPGSSMRYSGGAYSLLQLLIEEVTGETFSHFMKQNIFLPLCMTETSFDFYSLEKAEMAKSYGYFGNSSPYRLFVEQAAAGLYTSLKDMSLFLSAHIDQKVRGKVLSEQSYSELFRRLDKQSYGLGYHIVNIFKKRIVFNYGINKGWRSCFFVLPQSEEALAVFANSDGSENKVKQCALAWLEEKLGLLTPQQIELLNLKECSSFKSLIKNSIYLFK